MQVQRADMSYCKANYGQLYNYNLSSTVTKTYGLYEIGHCAKSLLQILAIDVTPAVSYVVFSDH